MRAPALATMLASAVRTATTNVDPHPFYNPQTNLAVADTSMPVPATSLIAYLNVTAVPGVDTVLLKMQEQNPVSGTWTDVPGAATLAQVASGLIKMIVGLGVTAAAASVTGVTVNALIPPIWRLVVVHSAASNFTYSLTTAIDIGL